MIENIIGFFLILILVEALFFIGISIYVSIVVKKYQNLELTEEQKEIIRNDIERYDDSKEEGFPLDELEFIKNLSAKINLPRAATIIAIEMIREEIKEDIKPNDDIDWEL